MFSQLIKSPSFWSLIGVIIGVILGFLLGEVSRYIRYRLRIYKLKYIVKDELKSILAQIPQKKDIVNKIIVSLEKEGSQEILSGLSVGIINTGYKQHIAELYEHLSLLQRNCLHVVHESLNIADKTLFSFENDFISALRENIIETPYTAYRGRFGDILKSYDVVEGLIKGYLDGKPTDVFYIQQKGRGSELSY